MAAERHDPRCDDSQCPVCFPQLREPLVSQETLREIARVSWNWPDGIHTREELAETEPGRRAGRPHPAGYGLCCTVNDSRCICEYTCAGCCCSCPGCVCGGPR